MALKLREASGKVSTETLAREGDVRIDLLAAWIEVKDAFPEEVRQSRWSRDVDMFFRLSKMRPVDEFSLNTIAVNIALLLPRVGRDDHPALARLARVDKESSLHLEYRQGISAAAQYAGLSAAQAERIHSIVLKAGDCQAGLLLAFLAQMGQLGRALSAAQYKFTAEEEYLKPLAERRLAKHGHMVGQRQLAAPVEQPPTIDIIGALWAIANR